MAQSVIVYVCLIASIFHVGSCLRCYQCHTTLTDRSCNDPFKPTDQLKECPDTISSNDTGSLFKLLPAIAIGITYGTSKICHKITLEGGFVIRICMDGKKEYSKSACDRLKEASKLPGYDAKAIKFCGSCDKDSCNGTGSLIYSLPLAFTALLTYFLF